MRLAAQLETSGAGNGCMVLTSNRQRSINCWRNAVCRWNLGGRIHTNKCTLVINIKQMEKSQQQQLLDRAGDVISYSKDNTFLPSLSDRMFRIFDWRWWNMTKWNENKRRGGPFCASVRKRPDGRENNKRRHPTVNNKTRRDKRERDKTHHLVPRTWPVSL